MISTRVLLETDNCLLQHITTVWLQHLHWASVRHIQRRLGCWSRFCCFKNMIYQAEQWCYHGYRRLWISLVWERLWVRPTSPWHAKQLAAKNANKSGCSSLAIIKTMPALYVSESIIIRLSGRGGIPVTMCHTQVIQTLERAKCSKPLKLCACT